MQKESKVEEKLKEQLQEFYKEVSQLKSFIEKLIRYPGYKFYKNKVEIALKSVNKSYVYLKRKLLYFRKLSLREKLEKFDNLVKYVLSEDVELKKKLIKIRELEFLEPELEVELEELKSYIPIFEVPKEIPMNEVRLDIEEATRNYEYDCYLSTLVMCRRAYEGALVEVFKLIEKKEPIEKLLCKKCRSIITKRYMGIAKLHKWAVEKGLVTQKLQQAGFLISDIGAGGAHPLADFQEISK